MGFMHPSDGAPPIHEFNHLIDGWDGGIDANQSIDE